MKKMWLLMEKKKKNPAVQSMEAYLSGHQSSLHVSGSPPILNVNWVICGRGTLLYWDLH